MLCSTASLHFRSQANSDKYMYFNASRFPRVFKKYTFASSTYVFPLFAFFVHLFKQILSNKKVIKVLAQKRTSRVKYIKPQSVQ